MYTVPQGNNVNFDLQSYSPPNGDNVDFSFSSIPYIFKDIPLYIRFKKEYFNDINLDIRLAIANDITTDIRFVPTIDVIKDVLTDIRIAKNYVTAFRDINSDIRFIAVAEKDINTDIRFGNFINVDKFINLDIRFSHFYLQLNNIYTDIRFISPTIGLPNFINFYIDEGDYTNSTTIHLKLEYNNATHMRFKNEGEDWSNWEPINSEKTWNVSSGNGSKTVYAQIKNSNGFSPTLDDTITLDDSVPSAPTIYCKTSRNGTIINDSDWTSDTDPFFYWDPPDVDTEIAGYSWAINEEPDESNILPVPNSFVKSGGIVSAIGGMKVSVSEVKYWKGNTYTTLNQSIFIVQAADPYLDRIDSIYIDTESQEIKYIAGNPSPNPSHPDLDSVYIRLADILVKKGSTQVDASNITDTRPLYIELDFENTFWPEGKNTFKVRAFTKNGSVGPIATFNLWIGPQYPNAYVNIRVYDNSSKTTEYSDGQFIKGIE